MSERPAVADLVYEAVSYIPRGKVLTYSDVAELAQVKSARAIGQILHKNPNPKTVPCHRVIKSDGTLASGYAFGGRAAQVKKLQAEGVKLQGGKIDLDRFLWRPSRVFKLYLELLKKYGPPGPWPWFGQGKPHTPEEIAIGAILTQNTAWRNVERALENLRRENVLGITALNKLARENLNKLKTLIRPAGFFNQKAAYLRDFSHAAVTAGGLKKLLTGPTPKVREKLLALRGIGAETADTILLYADEHPIFVIDAYTKRFTAYHRLTKNLDYAALQKRFMTALPQDLSLYRDFHALIVQWGKNSPTRVDRAVIF